MIFNENELKYLWPFYLSNLIYGLFMVIAPFVIIYFRDIGFSFFQISAIYAVISATTFLFEVPTGVFADRYSRKFSVVLGFVLVGLSGFFIPFSKEFYYILSLSALQGIGLSLISGADQAWVVDNLNKFREKKLHHEYFIKSTSITNLGFVLAPLIGAFIVKKYGLVPVWYVYGIGIILSGLIMLLGEEHYKPKRTSLLNSFKQSFSDSAKGFKLILRKKSLFYFIIGMLFVNTMDIGRNGWPPFLINLSMPTYMLGYMMSVCGVLAIFVPFLSRFIVKSNFKKVLSGSILLFALILFSVLFAVSPFFIFVALLFIFRDSLITFITPSTNLFVHRFIPREIRATTVSSSGMITRLASVFTGLISGVLLDAFGPQKVIAFGGIFGIFAIYFFSKIND